MNIGIMYFRYNSNTTKFVDTWLDVINNDSKVAASQDQFHSLGLACNGHPS